MKLLEKIFSKKEQGSTDDLFSEPESTENESTDNTTGDEDVFEPEPKPSKVMRFLSNIHLPFRKKKNLPDSGYDADEDGVPTENPMDETPAEEPKRQSPSGWDALPKGAKIAILSLVVGIGAFGFLAATGKVHMPWTQNNPAPTHATAKNNPPAEKKMGESFPGDIALASNPFVESKNFQKNDVPALPKPTVSAPAGSQAPKVSPPSTRVIPAIPKGSVPPAGSAPMPLVPSNSAATAPPATVQGVVVGEDGESVAIMSDGSVVAQGESFRDGRIAFIGGDGITFADGSTLQISEPK